MIPNAQRINRGGLVLPELVETARNHGFTDIVVLHEHRGEPGVHAAWQHPELWCGTAVQLKSTRLRRPQPAANTACTACCPTPSAARRRRAGSQPPALWAHSLFRPVQHSAAARHRRQARSGHCE